MTGSGDLTVFQTGALTIQSIAMAGGNITLVADAMNLGADLSAPGGAVSLTTATASLQDVWGSGPNDVWAVGGAVRDALGGGHPADWDLATAARLRPPSLIIVGAVAVAASGRTLVHRPSWRSLLVVVAAFTGLAVLAFPRFSQALTFLVAVTLRPLDGSQMPSSGARQHALLEALLAAEAVEAFLFGHLSASSGEPRSGSGVESSTCFAASISKSLPSGVVILHLPACFTGKSTFSILWFAKNLSRIGFARIERSCRSRKFRT